jgi:hypothetical protein
VKTFKNSEFKTFEQLASLKQSSLKKVLASFLKKHYEKVVHTDKYIFAEGNIPIALAAHMDTVFKTPPEAVYFDPKKNVCWSPDGLGADDRAGIFAIIQIIRAGLRPHIIFTTDEEIGGVGATALAQLDCPFKDLRYIIQLDRRGSNDCVFYDCDNEEFVTYVEAFGFEWSFGSYTDICEFCPKWEVAGVNLSIGYRDEHSVSETLFVGHMYSTIEKVKKMLMETDIPYFKYIPSKPYGYGYTSDWSFGYGGYSYGVIKCAGCKKYFMEEEMFPAVMLDKSTQFYCNSCLADKVAWCNECQSAFQKLSPEAPYTGTCPICKDLKENKNVATEIDR